MITEYRDWTIEWCNNRRAYVAISPDYDPIWLGEEEGYLDLDQTVEGDTLPAVMAEIDALLSEQAEYQADCAAEAELERRWNEED